MKVLIGLFVFSYFGLLLCAGDVNSRKCESLGYGAVYSRTSLKFEGFCKIGGVEFHLRGTEAQTQKLN